MLSVLGTARAGVRVAVAMTVLACGTTDPDPSGFTMAALVNSGSWRPGGAGTLPPTATLYTGDNTLILGGTQSGVSPNTRGITIQARNVLGTGSYPLAADSAGQSFAIYTESNGSIANGDWTIDFYWTSAARTGTLVVTEFDQSSQTISGNFSFTAVTGQGRVVTVTEGSFTGHYSSSPGSVPS